MRPWIARFAADGSIVWQHTFESKGAGLLRGVATDPAGFVAVGYVTPPGAFADALTVRIGADGVVVSALAPLTPGWDELYAIRPQPSGGHLVAGTRPPTGSGATAGGQPWFAALDASGNLAWQRWNTSGDSGILSAVATVAGAAGEIRLAGVSNSAKTESDVLILASGPYGHTSCADAGACNKLKVADCDDSNACTADDCAAQAGCVHSPLGVGAPCGAGTVCNAQGQCAK